MRVWASLRRWWARRGEDGLSALELTVASAVMIIVALMGFYALGTTSSASSLGADRSQAATVSGLALAQLRMEATSANILYNPATEGTNAGTSPDGHSIPAGFSLRIYTQANGLYTCVQWRVTDTDLLQSRSYSNQWQTNGLVRPWTTLLSGVVNPAGTPPFALDQGSNFGGSSSSRLLDVDLILGGAGITTPVEIKSSIAGRDAEYYPQNTGDCSPVPS